MPFLKAKLVAGPDVRIVDISRRGILLETDTRLLPNSPITIRFIAADASLVLKGCVVRSTIALLTGMALKYQTAVAFDEDIRLCDESVWAVGAEHGGEAEQADSSASTPSRETSPSPATAERVVTAVVDRTGSQLRDLLVENDW